MEWDGWGGLVQDVVEGVERERWLGLQNGTYWFGCCRSSLWGIGGRAGWGRVGGAGLNMRTSGERDVLWV